MTSSMFSLSVASAPLGPLFGPRQARHQRDYAAFPLRVRLGERLDHRVAVENLADGHGVEMGDMHARLSEIMSELLSQHVVVARI